MILGSNVQSIGPSAFHSCTNLENATVGNVNRARSPLIIDANAFFGASSLHTVKLATSNVVTIDSDDPFQGCSLLKYIYFNRDVQHIYGLLSYHCYDGSCSCSKGAGLDPALQTFAPHYFTCTQCQPGYYSADNELTACTPCREGSYAGEAGKIVCDKCESGKYSEERNATSSSVCVDCPRGKYSFSDGANGCAVLCRQVQQ